MIEYNYTTIINEWIPYCNCFEDGQNKEEEDMGAESNIIFFNVTASVRQSVPESADIGKKLFSLTMPIFGVISGLLPHDSSANALTAALSRNVEGDYSSKYNTKQQVDIASIGLNIAYLGIRLLIIRSLSIGYFSYVQLSIGFMRSIG